MAIGVASAIYMFHKAGKYEAAEDAYQRQRAEVLARLDLARKGQ